MSSPNKHQRIQDCPYKGLMPYLEEDAAFFFGREKWSSIITDNLISLRLTLVYGTSGVGKTSVLRAGVAHNLRQLAKNNLNEFGQPEFAVVAFNAWRDDPLEGLVQQVEKNVREIFPEVQVPERGTSLAKTLEDWAKALVSAQEDSGKLFIILDQFEEYFLYHTHEDGKGTFAVEFPRTVNQSGLPVNFLISIREEELAKLDRFKGRISNLFGNYLRIPQLDEESAVDAIRHPIRVYNQRQKPGAKSIGIETELVKEVLKEVKVGNVSIGESGRGGVDLQLAETKEEIETPYLQLVMTRLWEKEMKEGSDSLRLGTFKRLGGAENIVKQHLNERIEPLSKREKDIAAKVFQYLVTPGGTKIAYPALELAKKGRVSARQLQALLGKLSSPAQRILRPVGPSPENPNVERYEIFHDKLAPAILDWHNKYQHNQDIKRWQLVTTGVASLAIVFLGLLILAEYQRLQAAVSETKALLAASTARLDSQEYFDSLIDGLRAFRNLKSTENSWTLRWFLRSKIREDISLDIQQVLQRALARVNERNRLIVSQKKVLDVSFSNDGQMLATASKDGTIKLWNLDGKIITSLPENNTQASYFWRVSFSPNDQLLAAGSTSGKINLWSIDGNKIKELEPLKGQKGRWIFDLNFHPSQPILASASADGTVKLWRFNGQQIESEPVDIINVSDIERDGIPKDKKVVRTISFSHDGKILATGSDTDKASTIQLWSFKDQKLQLLKSFTKKHDDWIWDINFSPDDQLLGTASRDGTITLWNLEGEKLKTFNGHETPFTSIKFIVYGKKKEIIIVAASHDKTIKFWNREGEELTTLKGHKKGVWRTTVSPDGKTIATASEDGTVKVWNLKHQDLFGHEDTIFQVVFSRDGKFLATASKDNTVKLWRFDKENIYDLQYIKTIKAHKNFVTSVSFSPDISTLVTASWDKKAKLWNLESDQPLETFDKHTEEIWKVEHNPKLPLLGTVSSDGTAKLWNFDGTVHRDFDHFPQQKKDNVISLSFTPDGQRLATAILVPPNSGKNDVMIWDVNGGVTPIRQFSSLHKDWLRDMDVSPDGQMIATASKDGAVKLWGLDGTDQTPYQDNYSKINHHNSQIWSVYFSPIEPLLLTASDDKTVKLWTLDGQLKKTFFGHQGSVLSASFSPSGKFIASSGTDRRVILWNRDLALDRLVKKSCDWVRGYLKNNPNVKKDDQTLCKELDSQN